MPLTYEESASLMADFAFRGRIKVACLSYSTYILNEPPSTDGHSARYRWAQQVVQVPEQVATSVQPMVVMDAAVQDAGADITDAALQSAVEGVVNKVL